MQYNYIHFAYKFAHVNLIKNMHSKEFANMIDWCRDTFGEYSVNWVWGDNAIMLKDEVNPEDLIAFKLKFNLKQ